MFYHLKGKRKIDLSILQRYSGWIALLPDLFISRIQVDSVDLSIAIIFHRSRKLFGDHQAHSD